MAIKKRTLITYLMAVLAFHVTLVSIDTVYFPSYFKYKNIVILVLGMMLLPYIKTFFKKKYLITNFLLILFLFISYWSSYNNLGNKSSSIVSSMRIALSIFEFFLFCEYMEDYSEEYDGINTFWWCALLYAIISDILAVIDPHVETLIWGDTWTTYLIGSKFSIVYLHILLTGLTYVRACNKGYSNNRIRRLIGILILITLAVAILTGCASGIVAVALMLFVFYEKDFIPTMKEKPFIVMLAIALLDAILLVFTGIVNSAPIRFLLTNVLHRSADLTGRLGIFEKTGALIAINPLWGVGYDNNATLCKIFVGADDVQNGVLDIVVSYGILGTIILGVLVWIMLRKGSKYKNNDGFAIYIYVMILLSMVEITFRSTFFSVLALYAFCGAKCYRGLKYHE